MNHRTLAPTFLFILFVGSLLTAQQTPDSTNKRLATILHLPVLTSDDWRVLFSEAESGNVAAQYWLGRIYDAGRLLPKDGEKSARWFQKSAEQGYAPAEFAVCLMHANRKETLRANSACGAQPRRVYPKRSFGSVWPMISISGLESQISGRHLSGS